MRHQPASGHIRAARANLRLASGIGSANAIHLERVLGLLEATVSEMRLAEAALRSGLQEEDEEVRCETALLKREIACMMRVVDGCAALYRGLSVRLGCTPLTYTPQGRSATASPSAAAYEVQA